MVIFKGVLLYIFFLLSQLNAKFQKYHLNAMSQKPPHNFWV